MRTKILLLLLITITAVSCNNNDTCYSCDKELDTFVKDNLSRLDNLSRKEISEFPGNKQRAVYAGLTPEKRKEIWLEKLQQIKTLTLTSAELSMVNRFADFVNQKDFSRSITDIEDKFKHSKGRVHYQFRLDPKVYR